MVIEGKRYHEEKQKKKEKEKEVVATSDRGDISGESSGLSIDSSLEPQENINDTINRQHLEIINVLRQTIAAIDRVDNTIKSNHKEQMKFLKSIFNKNN
jgi:hypothetical protein